MTTNELRRYLYTRKNLILNGEDVEEEIDFLKRIIKLAETF